MALFARTALFGGGDVAKSYATRRKFLLASAGAVAVGCLPVPAFALAPSNLETSISSAIYSWSTRTGGNGSALASEAVTIFGKYYSMPAAEALSGMLRTGAIGLAAVDGVLLLNDLAHYLTTTNQGYSVNNQTKSSSTTPSSTTTIRSQAGVNGVITYSGGDVWAYLHYPAGASTAVGPKGFGSQGTWANGDGSTDELWYKSSAQTAGYPPEGNGASPWSGLATDSAFTAQQTQALASKSAVDMLNTMLDAANQASPSTVPSPSVAPFTAADIANSTFKGSDLATPIPQTMQITNGTGAVSSTPTPTNTTSNATGDENIDNWGNFTAPGLNLPALNPPAVDQPQTILNTITNPLSAIMPQQSISPVACPALPWFNNTQITTHCTAWPSFEPYVLAFSHIAAQISAFFIILKSA